MLNNKKKALMKENQQDVKDIEMMDDPVPMLTKRHFEIGMLKSRKSVTEVDLSKYDDFKRKFDPTFVVNNPGGGAKIAWPDDDGKQQSNNENNKNDDLDLYS